MRRLGGTVGRRLPLAGGLRRPRARRRSSGPAPRLFRRGRLERRPCGDAQRPRLPPGRRRAATTRCRPRRRGSARSASTGCRTSTRATASRWRRSTPASRRPRPRRAPARARRPHERARRHRPLRPRHAHGGPDRGRRRTTLEAFEGAAPEASLVSVKVAGWDGATDVSTVIAGAAVGRVEPRPVRHPRRQPLVGHRREPRLRRRPARLRGRARVGGRPRRRRLRRQRRPGRGTISKPGDDPFVITVGAADIARHRDRRRRHARAVLESRADRGRRRQAGRPRPGRLARLRPRARARRSTCSARPRGSATHVQGLRHLAGRRDRLRRAGADVRRRPGADARRGQGRPDRDRRPAPGGAGRRRRPDRRRAPRRPP